EGDIGYLEDPPPVPGLLAVFAMCLLVLGGVVASFVGNAFLLAYGICSILSILYSVPPFGSRRVPGGISSSTVLGTVG
ncbi:MAG: hypothetical protein MUQ10_03390, partial [Anaerolineae bacterium]|nr:hypothetical protein [Anaerolineae bacterium]